MNNALKVIQLASLVSQKEQDEWKQLSEEVLAEGEIERLSAIGLFEAIGYIAHIMVTDAADSANALLLGQSLSEVMVSDRVKALPEIHYIMCIASGVHPIIVTEMIDNQVDIYAEEYLFHTRR